MNNDSFIYIDKVECDEIDTNHLKIKLESILIALVFCIDIDGDIQYLIMNQ